jgi:uncharacterized protein YeaO (DUF488 family)
MSGPRVKRVYDPPAEEDGFRVLVDRLWPRGLSKAAARIDLWLKAVSPSDALRREFHAHSHRWEDFRRAYAAELAAEPAATALRDLAERCAAGPVTLLYAAREPERNNAVALRDLLIAQAHSARR